MKRYDVYALGNALVDLEYRVEAETLAALGVDKGVMTLVDEARQAELMAALAGREVGRGSGGSAANTVTAVAQLGGRAFYSCRVADDELGRFYVQDLLHAGVESNVHPARHGEGHTGRCLVFVTPDADRTMNTFLGVSAAFAAEDVDEAAVAAARWLYIEGYLVAGEPTRGAAEYAMERARSCGTPVALSLSDPNIVRHFRPVLEAWLDAGGRPRVLPTRPRPAT
ncbi:MAG: hypothetical protein KatS3mg121_0765 [Gammaproteobacteria bacterium]|nr:MAG: hypothetical protein KatS3mg121_0765 [Gammaproteobacteria bacterium]